MTLDASGSQVSPVDGGSSRTERNAKWPLVNLLERVGKNEKF